MKTVNYIVYAANGKEAARFSTYAAANEFTMLNGGSIRTVYHHQGLATPKQKKAVVWAAKMLNIILKGDINKMSFDWADYFLSRNLHKAVAQQLINAQEQGHDDIEMLENSHILDKDYYE